jgi:IS30 family transposase
MASRLPKADREKPKRFKAYEIGSFQIDIAELRYEGGRAFLFLAVDRTSKIVFARIYREATKLVAAGFLKALVKTVPYPIHTVPSDDGGQFAQHDKRAANGFVGHIFGAIRAANGIEHRQTKPYPPWTKGQAERRVRTIKDATVKSFHHASINDPRRHVRDWPQA